MIIIDKCVAKQALCERGARTIAPRSVAVFGSWIPAPVPIVSPLIALLFPHTTRGEWDVSERKKGERKERERREKRRGEKEREDGERREGWGRSTHRHTDTHTHTHTHTHSKPVIVCVVVIVVAFLLAENK